jgi:hypothetical protein
VRVVIPRLGHVPESGCPEGSKPMRVGRVTAKRPMCRHSCLLQPLSDEAWRGVDVHALVPAWPSRELVRDPKRNYQDLPGVAAYLLGADSERCGPSTNDEGLGAKAVVTSAR